MLQVTADEYGHYSTSDLTVVPINNGQPSGITVSTSATVGGCTFTAIGTLT